MNADTSTVTIRLYEPSDFEGLQAVMSRCFADLEVSAFTEEEMSLLHKLYPRGQVVCLVNGVIAGATTSRIVRYADFAQPHTQEDCIDTSRFLSDKLNGDCVYGLDVFVDPQYQSLKLGKQLIKRQFGNIFEDNYWCVMGISRLVGYPNYMEQYDIETYTEKVRQGEIYDPALTFHLRNGMEFVCSSPNFSKHDHASGHHGVVVCLKNPDFVVPEMAPSNCQEPAMGQGGILAKTSSAGRVATNP